MGKIQNEVKPFDCYVIGIESEYLPNCRLVMTPLSVEFADHDLAEMALGHIMQKHPTARIWGYRDEGNCGKINALLSQVRKRDAHYLKRFSYLNADVMTT